MRFEPSHPEALADLVMVIESGCGLGVMPLGVQGLCGGHAGVILTIGGVRHGISADDAALMGRMIGDEAARPDAAVIAFALFSAAEAARQTVAVEELRPKGDDGEHGWRGQAWPGGARWFDPVLVGRAA